MKWESFWVYCLHSSIKRVSAASTEALWCVWYKEDWRHNGEEVWDVQHRLKLSHHNGKCSAHFTSSACVSSFMTSKELACHSTRRGKISIQLFLCVHELIHFLEYSFNHFFSVSLQTPFLCLVSLKVIAMQLERESLKFPVTIFTCYISPSRALISKAHLKIKYLKIMRIFRSFLSRSMQIAI